MHYGIYCAPTVQTVDYASFVEFFNSTRLILKTKNSLSVFGYK